MRNPWHEHLKLFRSTSDDVLDLLVCPEENCLQFIPSGNITLIPGEDGFDFTCPACGGSFRFQSDSTQKPLRNSGVDDGEGAPGSDRSVGNAADSSYLELNRIIVDGDSGEFEVCSQTL